MPLELDQIYSSLDRLTVALGPNGANENGALTDLLEQTAKNFGGQGAKFKQTIEDFGTLSATLDNNKEELFGSLTELEGFVSTLADNDATVRELQPVARHRCPTLLAGESEELSAALANLSTALGQVGSLRPGEQGVAGPQHHRASTGWRRCWSSAAPSSTRSCGSGPVALSNLAMTYNPDTGTLDTNANIGNLEHELASDPGRLLCALVSANDPNGKICDLIGGLVPAAAGAHRAGFGATGPAERTSTGSTSP